MYGILGEIYFWFKLITMSATTKTVVKSVASSTPKLTKTFLTTFEKETGISVQLIDSLDEYNDAQELFEMKNLVINGFVINESKNACLFVCQLPSTKKLLSVDKYKQYISTSNLLLTETCSNVENVYILIYKNSENYYTFKSNDNNIEVIEDFKLNMFVDIIGDGRQITHEETKLVPTRTTRTTRTTKRTSTKSMSSTSTSTNGSGIPKTFKDNFKKMTGLELQPTNELFVEMNEDDFTLDNGINICAYVKDEENVLFVSYNARKKLAEQSYYRQLISESNLLNVYSEAMNVKGSYWLFVKKLDKKESELMCFKSIDSTNEETNECELIPGFMIQKLSEIFKAEAMNSSEARSKYKDTMDDLYAGLNINSSEMRIQFTILTWILLKHEEIPIKTFPDAKSYSLKQYIELVKQHNEQKYTKAETSAQFKLDQVVIDSIESKDIFNAFEQVIHHKMMNHTSTSMTMKANNERQIKKLRGTIDELFNQKFESLALFIADNIYRKIFIRNPDLDINKLAFDAETHWFKRGKNSKVASNGMFFTHHMIKDLTIKLLGKNIKNGSTCYDPTCGTGGFSEHFHVFCGKNGIKDIIAYGTEIEDYTANMAWINGLCSDEDVRVFCLNCFDPIIKNELIPKNSIDFLLMNPPYGQKTDKFRYPINFIWEEETKLDPKGRNTEWIYCRYNLETFVKEGGWFAFVIPISTVSNNRSNTYDKKKLIEKCEIWFVIKIREDIFTPQAGKACVLVIGKFVGNRSKTEISSWKTKCIDFSKDCGVKEGSNSPIVYKDMKELEKLWNERIFDNKCLDGLHGERLVSILDKTNELGKQWYEERVLTADIDWVFRKRVETDINTWSIKWELNKIEVESCRNRTNAMIKHRNDVMNNNIVDNCSWIDITIGDYFEPGPKPKGNSKYNVNQTSEYATEEKQIPFYSMLDHDNGLRGFVEIPAVEGDGYYIMVGNYSSKNKNAKESSESNKYCSYLIQAPFNYDSVHTIVIKPNDKLSHLDEEELRFIAFMIGVELEEKYSYSDSINRTNLLNEHIRLPYNEKLKRVEPKLLSFFNNDDLYKVRYENLNINEVFEIITGIRRDKTDTLKPGIYPLVSSSGVNQGIIKYVDKYNYEGTCISWARSGTVGACFVHTGKIELDCESTRLLRLKPEYQFLEPVLYELAHMMTERFMTKYSYSDMKLSKGAMEQEVIENIPFVEDLKNPGKWIIDVEYIRLMMLRPTPTMILKDAIRKFNNNQQ